MVKCDQQHQHQHQPPLTRSSAQPPEPGWLFLLLGMHPTNLTQCAAHPASMNRPEGSVACLQKRQKVRSLEPGIVRRGAGYCIKLLNNARPLPSLSLQRGNLPCSQSVLFTNPAPADTTGWTPMLSICVLLLNLVGAAPVPQVLQQWPVCVAWMSTARTGVYK